MINFFLSGSICNLIVKGWAWRCTSSPRHKKIEEFSHFCLSVSEESYTVIFHFIFFCFPLLLVHTSIDKLHDRYISSKKEEFFSQPHIDICAVYFVHTENIDTRLSILDRERGLACPGIRPPTYTSHQYVFEKRMWCEILEKEPLPLFSKFIAHVVRIMYLTP